MSIQLKVAEAREQRDVGRSIARINSETMRKLGVSTGDVLELIGKRNTAAKAWPAYPEDEEQDVIRIDGYIRNNSGVSIHEFINVKKAKPKPATTIRLAPVDIRISVDSDFVRFVKERLIDIPCTRRDVLPIMMLGHSVSFTVVNTQPTGIVNISHRALVYACALVCP